MPKKRAKISESPQPQKRPKLTPRLDAEDDTILFSFQWFDTGHKWGSSAKHKFWAIADKLKSCEGKTWAHLSADRNDHYINLENFPRETEEAILHQKLDEFDGLWSLHVTGAGRLWGIQWADTRYFMVVWWDPDHQVYPVPKKHT